MHRAICSAMMILFVIVSSALAMDEQSPPIRVGVLHSRTGPMAISERSLIDAVTMAIEEINDRGGVLGRSLEAVTEDGASDPQIFAQKAAKLIVEDNVNCIFGCWTSASRKEVKTVVETHNSLLWYPVQYEGRENSPNIFYNGATPNQQILPAVDWCRREFGPKIFLVGSDYIFPRTANEIIRMRLEDEGIKPIGEEYQPLDSQDFDAVVSQIVASQPDVVLSTINGISNRAFFKSMHAARIDHQAIPVLSFSIAEHEILDIGPELTTGHYCSWTYFQSLESPANRRFVRKFRKRFGAMRVTDDPVESAYTQVYLYAKSLQVAGTTDTDAVREAAQGLIFAAPGGLIRIDPRNQHTWKVAHIGRIQPDGQFAIVWSSEDPLPPQPYLPQTFLHRASAHGSEMLASISTIFDLEVAESQKDAPDSRVAEIAQVRVILNEARTRFRTACTAIHSGNRLEFEQAWANFDQQRTILASQQEALSELQRASFEQFNKACDAYADNAAAMFNSIYPDAKDSSEVIP